MVSWEIFSISVLIYFILVSFENHRNILVTRELKQKCAVYNFIEAFEWIVLYKMFYFSKVSKNHYLFHFFSGMFLYSSSCSCISLAVSLLSNQRRRCPSPLGFYWVLVAFTTGQFISVWPAQRELHALHYSPQQNSTLLPRSELFIKSSLKERAAAVWCVVLWEWAPVSH